MTLANMYFTDEEIAVLELAIEDYLDKHKVKKEFCKDFSAYSDNCRYYELVDRTFGKFMLFCEDEIDC